MIDKLNTILWLVASSLIFISGIYFTFKIKFSQFNFKEIFKTLKVKGSKDSISPVQTLTLNLAARIGVGSITGIALALYLGGVGTIFWMWITALIASSNTFIESVLAVLFREKDSRKIYKGGPSFYIEKGLKKPNMAKLYSFIIILAFIAGFLTIQSNTITVGIVSIFDINPLTVGIVIAVITGLIIIKGVKGIAETTNILVPFMGILYFIICCIIIFKNLNILPNMLKDIFIAAFNVKSAGVGILTTFLIGMQRGIFSNEAGIGTGAIAAATTDTDNPCSQGYIQSLGIYIDTLVVGTLSALVVMCCDYKSLNIIDANGFEIAKYAFSYHLGDFGSIMLLIIIILFAMATIITGYYYGESSIKYIKKTSNTKQIKYLKIFTLILLILGSVLSSSFIWKIVDIFVAILAIINIYALWNLKDYVINEIKK